MLKEFKKFAMRGNVMDMAVGIILGGAFGLIVASLVKDVLMPPIGMALGAVDFSDLAITLKEAVTADDGTAASEAIQIRYGLFLNAIINFVIVAFSIFVMVKVMNKLQAEEAEAPKPAEPPAQEKLLAEIRDLLKAEA